MIHLQTELQARRDRNLNAAVRRREYADERIKATANDATSQLVTEWKEEDRIARSEGQAGPSNSSGA